VQDIAQVQRPLELRFRRGSRMPGHTEVGIGTQAARQRIADQTHERARVARRQASSPDRSRYKRRWEARSAQQTRRPGDDERQCCYATRA
jgi:hypothetical protein